MSSRKWIFPAIAILFICSVYFLVMEENIVMYQKVSQQEAAPMASTLRSESVDQIRNELKEIRTKLDHLMKNRLDDEVKLVETNVLSTQLHVMNQEKEEDTMHIVFSTGCAQLNVDVTTVLLQYSANKVGHRGPITRIVSGCDEKQKEKLQKVTPVYPNYHLYFTEDYSEQEINGTMDSYLPYNKPFALRNWMENTQIHEKIVALVDADFVFLRPLEVNQNRRGDILRYEGKRNKSLVSDEVRPGVAVAQDWMAYMMGGFWEHESKIAMEICKDEPCGKVGLEDAREYFASTGPPYIMHIDDMRKFMDDYCRLTVEARKAKKFWMAEMYGFALAAANHDIKFTRLNDLGVTHPSYGNRNHEYWSFVDTIPINVCDAALSDEQVFNATLFNAFYPTGLHLCQVYGNVKVQEDTWAFYKYQEPLNLLKCNAHSFKLPPAALWPAALQAEKPPESRGAVWVECFVTRLINHAIHAHKSNNCEAGFINTPDFEMKNFDKHHRKDATKDYRK